MAISNNALTKELRGMIGGVVVFRQVNGKTIVSNRPSKPKRTTARQIEHREKFTEAAHFAKAILKTPEHKLYYEQRAKELGLDCAYKAAFRDIMRGISPEGGKIGVQNLNVQNSKLKSESEDSKLSGEGLRVTFKVKEEKLGKREDVKVRKGDWCWEESESRRSQEDGKMEGVQNLNVQDSKLKEESLKQELGEVRGLKNEVRSLGESESGESLKVGRMEAVQSLKVVAGDEVRRAKKIGRKVKAPSPRSG